MKRKIFLVPTIWIDKTQADGIRKLALFKDIIISCHISSFQSVYILREKILLSGKPGFTKKQADLFFPPDFADDFPVAMQVTSEALSVRSQ